MIQFSRIITGALRTRPIFFLVEPALAAAINPEALSAHSMLVQIVSDTSLLASVPATFVLATIAPDEFSLTVALIL